MEKQIAVWLVQRGYADDVEQGVRFAEALAKNECTEEMLETLGHNIDIFMTVGGPITAENLMPFMQEKCNMAKKLIKFWSENPKDTNAIFFFNECRKHDVEVGQ
ncbi:MAG: hypothetical protein K6F95_12405 [Selenomonas sp.]|uniref:hypothetical protein n=1 Tax=Selenomonas sp. TaxID=2053611 RepID=UPI0025EAE74A|nr:hypothetical protein [Selenomonas sp.]MCR5758686.1 hypothetical protein [Selenomonas sp.]